MRILLLIAILSILGMVNISYANGECKDWNDDCNKCNEGKCGYFIDHNHEDKGICISKDRISDVGNILKDGYELSKNCTPNTNSSETVSKTKIPQPKVEITTTELLPPSEATASKNHMNIDSTKKSFNGGVFFGGIVFAIALLVIFAYGWNKVQSMRNGSPVKYGLLSPKQANSNGK